MIKVLHICGGKLDFGGITSWILNYVSNIDKKFQVEIVCFGFEKGEREQIFKDLGVNVLHVPYLSESPIKNYRELKRIIEVGQYDIIHSHLEAMNAYSLWLSKKCGVKKRVSHSHGTDYYGGGLLKRIVYDRLKKRINHYATCKMACSNAAGKWLYGTNEYIVIPNAVDYSKFAFDENIRRVLRRRLDIDDDTIVIGTIGHLSKIKNQIFLIQILHEICDIGKYIVVIVGEGEEKSLLCAEIARMGLREKVFFIPPQQNVEEYYQMFDIFALPSLHEGLPLVAVEAQVSGLPLLISEGVPDDVIISNRTKRIPLDVELWGNTITSINEGASRHEIDIDDSFDVANCVAELERIYETGK